MSYRKDARPSCQWCGGAFDAEELSFDALGRVTCRGCYDRAASKQADVDEKRARRRVRIGRVVGGIVLTGVAAFYVFFFALPQLERAKAREESAALQRRLAERMLQVKAASTLPKGSPTTTPCDDAAIRARTRGAHVPWSEATIAEGTLGFHHAQSRTFARVEAASRFLPPGGHRVMGDAVSTFEGTGVAVVVVWGGGVTDPALPEPRPTVNDAEEERGSVIVISLAEGRATPLCWAPIVLGVDVRQKSFADAQRAAQVSLEPITKVVALEGW